MRLEYHEHTDDGMFYIMYSDAPESRFHQSEGDECDRVCIIVNAELARLEARIAELEAKSKQLDWDNFQLLAKLETSERKLLETPWEVRDANLEVVARFSSESGARDYAEKQNDERWIAFGSGKEFTIHNTLTGEEVK